MLSYVKGNLFASPAKVLVNTLNTVGVMTKGSAIIEIQSRFILNIE